jgi:inner membrane protein
LDNICHTLVGGALARAGFDKRTPLATATMMIGANFPDIDVVSVPFGADIGFRRGVTHGWPAHILLPFALTAVMLAWDRWVRRRKDPSLAPVVPKEILLLSAVSIATHPFLDWCNSYGMRWLMPVKNQWFYGDSLFIVDLWLWITLFAGYWLAGRGRRVAARLAVAASAVYIAAMMAGTLAIRSRIQDGAPLDRRTLMVAPVALNPFARQVVLARSGVYHVGRWSPGAGLTWSDTIPINRGDPAVATVLRDPAIQPFIHWARFPFFIVNHAADGRTIVEIADARYTDRYGGGWASRTVVLHPR